MKQDLRTRAPILLEYLKDKGYSKYYIGLFRLGIRYVLRLRDEHPDISYEEIHQTRVDADPSHRPLIHWLRIFRIIERFEETGIFPGQGYVTCREDKKYNALSDEFRRVIDIYRKEEPKTGKRPMTILRESRLAMSFFCALQKQGVFTFDEAQDTHIQTALSGYSRGYRKIIRVVIRRCAPFFENGLCERIIAMLPMTRNKRRNIDYLTAEEIERVKTTLTNAESGLCLRDKAVGLLALYTGLRGCDILGMRLQDIDWNNDTISIIQDKTSVPLKLPLRPVVGNAIYDYISRERPKCDAEEIFVSRCPLHLPLRGKSAHNIADKIMRAAGIRQDKGSRKGLHIFRHHIATHLLGQGIPQPVISSVMGHTSPSSLNPYLSADFLHLKECALSIDPFPVGKGVFHD